MNDIINKFLLVGDKFMPEMLLRQLRFTKDKNKEMIQKRIFTKTKIYLPKQTR